jgi:hypothetical protein
MPSIGPTLGVMSDEVHLDRAAVARIIRRASELAGPESTDDSAGTIEESALMAAANEVGLPVIAVQRSIAAERLGVMPDPRFTDRLLGPGVVAIDDEIAGSAHDVLDRVDAWLVEGHHLRRDRLREGRGEWSKRTGVVGVTMRKLRGATGEGRLGRNRRITAVAQDIGSGSAVVRVAVDRSADRRRSALGSVIVVVGSTGGLAVAAVASAPIVLVVTPFAVAGGVSVAMTSRARAARTVREVERMLESVADHEPPTRLRTEVARRVRGRRPSRQIRADS